MWLLGDINAPSDHTRHIYPYPPLITVLRARPSLARPGESVLPLGVFSTLHTQRRESDVIRLRTTTQSFPSWMEGP